MMMTTLELHRSTLVTTGAKQVSVFAETRFIRFVVCMRIVLVTDFNLGPTRFARLDRNGACKRSLKTSQNGFHVPSPNSFSPVLGVLNTNRLPFQVETAPERS